MKRLLLTFALACGVMKALAWLTVRWLFPASFLGGWLLALDPFATWAARNFVLLFVWRGSFGPTLVERVIFDVVLISTFAIECGLIGFAAAWITGRIKRRAAIT